MSAMGIAEDKKKRKAEKDCNIKAKKSKYEVPLIQSIASYLSNRGFTKTLSSLLKESQCGDSWASGAVDLVDALKYYLKHLSENSLGNKMEESQETKLVNGDTDSKKLDKHKPGEGLNKRNEESETKSNKKSKSQANGTNDAVGAKEKLQSLERENMEKQKEMELSDAKKSKKKKRHADEKNKDTAELVDQKHETKDVVEPSDVKKSKKKKEKKGIHQSGASEKENENTQEAIGFHSEKKSKKKKLAKKNDSDDTERNQEKQDDKGEMDVQNAKKLKRKHRSEKNPEEVFETAEEKHDAKKEKKAKENSSEKRVSKGIDDDENEATPLKNGEDSATLNVSSKTKEKLYEPTTAKAFQRVKIEAVKFADPRLEDNSYWSKSGAEIGYGAKAQEVLGQVKGKDFRHEKTKKKRGSYKGGFIDLQSHSIKFNYSDEE